MGGSSILQNTQKSQVLFLPALAASDYWVPLSFENKDKFASHFQKNPCQI